MHSRLQLLFYIMFILFTSCEQPTEYITEYVEVEVEKEVIVTNEIIIDNIIETRTIEYVEKEIYIMSEEEIIVVAVEPITEYDNYVTSSNKVFGVTANGFEEIESITGLFRIDNTVYFKIGELCYSQSSGVITEIDVADYPEVPTNEYISFSYDNFKIEISTYNDLDISRVYTGTKVTAYKQIDGACLRGSDLLFSVSETYSTRYKGIYLLIKDGSPSKLSSIESGRIW